MLTKKYSTIVFLSTILALLAVQPALGFAGANYPPKYFVVKNGKVQFPPGYQNQFFDESNKPQYKLQQDGTYNFSWSFVYDGCALIYIYTLSSNPKIIARISPYYISPYYDFIQPGTTVANNKWIRDSHYTYMMICGSEQNPVSSNGCPFTNAPF